MSSKDRNMTIQERELLKRAAALEYDTDRLGPSALMTQQSHISSSRMIMGANQMTQFVDIKNPEVPLVATGFENKLASYSTMLLQADENYEIVAKFVKDEYTYVLVGFDRKHRRYHAWKRVELEEHSEGCCTRYNNSYLDSLEVGDVIHAGEYIKKSESFDKYQNYRYGKNLNSVLLISTRVLEDGILLMNGAEHMMNTYRSTHDTIMLAENEILLNWYGDSSHYQPLPKIGEKTKDGVLGIVRRIDNSKAPYAMKAKRLRIPEQGDRYYYGEGRVIGYDIYYNYKDYNRMPTVGAFDMLREMFDRQQMYHMSVYKYLRSIVDGAKSDDYTFTDELTIICEESHAFVDSSAFFVDSNSNIYGNIMIKAHIMGEEKLRVGSKLVDRHGGKGVVSMILPPEKSWRMEDGRPIHLVRSALGIVGRLNQAVMNEHSANELSNTASEMMRLTDSVDKKLKIVHNLLRYLNPEEAKSFKAWYKALDSKGREKLAKRIERQGIVIIQEPIDNADMFDIGNAYGEFPPNWQRIVFEDGGKSLRKVLCSKMYYIRLKQDPLDKYSARSRGPVHPMTMLPAKSAAKKKGLALHSNVPVRFGEYEIEVLLGMVNHPAMIASYMCESSTSWLAKVLMAEQTYMGDLEEDVDLSMIEFAGKKSKEQIDAYSNILSAQVVIDVEEAPEGEWFED